MALMIVCGCGAMAFAAAGFQMLSLPGEHGRYGIDSCHGGRCRVVSITVEGDGHFVCNESGRLPLRVLEQHLEVKLRADHIVHVVLVGKPEATMSDLVVAHQAASRAGVRLQVTTPR